MFASFWYSRSLECDGGFSRNQFFAAISRPKYSLRADGDPGYLGGPADWTPHWSRFGGVWLCPIYVPNQDRSDVFSYDVFFDDINEEVCRKFRQHACEVAALLERLGCELGVGICRESELVRTLFERNRTELQWEENEEPEHPETKSLIGRLKDIYGHTETFLSDLLEEFTPTSPEQRSQADKEIEVDRQSGKADNESGPTTMPNTETLALRNEVESGPDAVDVQNSMRRLTNVPAVEPGTSQPAAALVVHTFAEWQTLLSWTPTTWARRRKEFPDCFNDVPGENSCSIREPELSQWRASAANKNRSPFGKP